MCQCVCVTLVVFIHCESCTRPISTNPGYTEASECCLKGATCFVAPVSRWWRSPGRCGFRGVFSVGRTFPFIFFGFISAFERTRPAASMRRLASFTFLLILGRNLDPKISRIFILAHADSRRVVPWGLQFFCRPRWHTGDVTQGRFILLSAPHVGLSNFDPPDRWGGDLTPYPIQNTVLTGIKNRTLGTIESRPCPAIYNRTQETIESHPP